MEEVGDEEEHGGRRRGRWRLLLQKERILKGCCRSAHVGPPIESARPFGTSEPLRGSASNRIPTWSVHYSDVRSLF